MNQDQERDVLYGFSQTGVLSGGNFASPMEHMLADIIIRLKRIEEKLDAQSTSEVKP